LPRALIRKMAVIIRRARRVRVGVMGWSPMQVVVKRIRNARSVLAKSCVEVRAFSLMSSLKAELQRSGEVEQH
jgi:hypothetical protein